MCSSSFFITCNASHSCFVKPKTATQLIPPCRRRRQCWQQQQRALVAAVLLQGSLEGEEADPSSRCTQPSSSTTSSITHLLLQARRVQLQSKFYEGRGGEGKGLDYKKETSSPATGNAIQNGQPNS